MASVIEICNAALARLALGPITALDHGSREAEACTALYTQARDEALAAARPRFAQFRRSVAADAAPPDHGFTARFSIPSTCLLVLEVTDGYSTIEGWQSEGGYVLADYAGPIKLKSVEQVEDPGKFSPGFTAALVALLAFKLCVPMQENRSLAVDLWAEYQKTLKDAKAQDNLQGVGRDITNSWLQRARG